jgi:hypothetical protein
MRNKSYRFVIINACSVEYYMTAIKKAIVLQNVCSHFIMAQSAPYAGISIIKFFIV